MKKVWVIVLRSGFINYPFCDVNIIPQLFRPRYLFNWISCLLYSLFLLWFNQFWSFESFHFSLVKKYLWSISINFFLCIYLCAIQQSLGSLLFETMYTPPLDLKGNFGRQEILCSFSLKCGCPQMVSMFLFYLAALPGCCCGDNLAPSSFFSLVDDFLLLSELLDESLFMKFDGFKKIHIDESILYQFFLDFFHFSADSNFSLFQNIFILVYN